VAVAGSFNSWSPTATPLTDDDGDGIWTGALDVAPGSHQYKFVIDGTSWVKDPMNPDTADDGFGGENSLVGVSCDGVLPPVNGFGGAGGLGGAGGNAGAEAGGAGASAAGAAQGGAGAEAGAAGNAAGGAIGTAGAAGAAGASCTATEFSLTDDAATSVALAGSFNGWSPTEWPLSDGDGDGIWTGAFDLASGSYQYKFVVDGANWITDPANPDLASDGYGGWNSVVTVVCE
jgi:hypothetical protein